jgi:hypothetical protein
MGLSEYEGCMGLLGLSEYGFTWVFGFTWTSGVWVYLECKHMGLFGFT